MPIAPVVPLSRPLRVPIVRKVVVAVVNKALVEETFPFMDKISVLLVQVKLASELTVPEDLKNVI